MQKIAINWENGNDKDEYDQKVNEKNYELKIISFERQQFVLKVDGVPMTNCQKKSHLVFAGVWSNDDHQRVRRIHVWKRKKKK